jgi:CspA family cold shock protein
MKRLNRGRVRSFNEEKGYGFIIAEDGRLVFAHYTNIDGSGWRTLEYNEAVEFDMYETTEGLTALNIKPMGGTGA